MVLQRQRRAEQSHDPVAHHLIDGTLVAVHRFEHACEHGIEQSTGLLRVAVGEQLHRALEVGEEHCHLLALALDRMFRQQDALG